MQITLIGAAGINVQIKSKHAIVPGESNPADVSLRASGEARNIASMLARQDTKVSLITAVGNDPLGALLKESCEHIGINTDAWIIKNHACTWVNFDTQDNSGELYAGFNATTVIETIKTGELSKHKNLIHDADLLILDLNLTEKILTTALDIRAGRAVLVDGVSAPKAKRIENLLGKVSMLKLNRRQAESLTGITLDTKDRVRHACYKLVTAGTGRVFVTLGVAGVCASDEHNTVFVPTQPVAVKDVAGSGAAFVTGLVMGMDFDLRAQAEQGVAYARAHLEMYAKKPSGTSSRHHKRSIRHSS